MNKKISMIFKNNKTSELFKIVTINSEKFYVTLVNLKNYDIELMDLDIFLSEYQLFIN